MTENTTKTTKKSTPTQDSAPSAVAQNTSFELTLPWSAVQAAYDHEVQHAASHLKMAGFRAGKVPAAMAEKQIDQEKLIPNILLQVVPSFLEKAFQEAGDKYRPVTQPAVQPITSLKGADWKVKVSFAEAPKIKLGDYKKLVKAGLKDAEKEITEQTKALKKAASEMPNAKTDKNSAEATPETTPNTAPTDLTEEQRKEIRLRFIFKQLVQELQPAIAEMLIREETEYRLQNLAHSLQQFKIELQEYLKRRNASIEQVIAEFQAEALASLQLEFILSEIGQTAKIEVADADREQALAEIKDEKLQAQYKTDKEYQNRLTNTLYRRKIVEHLLSL